MLPGPGRLLVHGPQSSYLIRETSDRELRTGIPGGERNYAHAIEKIDPAPDAGPIELSVSLTPGATITGRMVDEQGNRIDEALVITRLKISPWFLEWRGDVQPTLGGNFELSGLDPHESYLVYFLDPKRRLGATEILRADSRDSTVVLKPCGQATVNLVETHGLPLPGVNADLKMVVTPSAWPAANSKISAGIDSVARGGLAR